MCVFAFVSGNFFVVVFCYCCCAVCVFFFSSFDSFSSSALWESVFYLLKRVHRYICVYVFMSDVTDLRNDEEDSRQERQKTHTHFTTQWLYPIHRDDRFIFFHHLDQWLLLFAVALVIFIQIVGRFFLNHKLFEQRSRSLDEPNDQQILVSSHFLKRILHAHFFVDFVPSFRFDVSAPFTN